MEHIAQGFAVTEMVLSADSDPDLKRLVCMTSSTVDTALSRVTHCIMSVIGVGISHEAFRA